jgi:type III pantothenate kinase
MTVLLVDVGNSRVKWARFDRGVLGEQQAAAHAAWSMDDWRAALFEGAGVERVVAASVAGGTSLAALDEAARAATGRGIERVTTQRAAAGVVNGYADPGSLGVDRWLAVIGAWGRVHGACVVADIGTAATVDVVAADGRHCGGYIVPGPRLMVASLLRGTSDLASLHSSSPAGGGPAFADNTRDAIERGCRVALAAWVGRCVGDARSLLDTTPRLLLTGGAAGELQPFLDLPGEEVPDLVLRGMAECISVAPG